MILRPTSKYSSLTLHRPRPSFRCRPSRRLSSAMKCAGLRTTTSTLRTTNMHCRSPRIARSRILNLNPASTQPISRLLITAAAQYQGIAIRYQSPYPDVKASGYAALPTNGSYPAGSTAPTTTTPSATTRYTAPAYGGQPVGDNRSRCRASGIDDGADDWMEE